MDRVFADIMDGEHPWAIGVIQEPELLPHMQAPVRITLKNAHGETVTTWNHTGPDHLYHAAVYDTMVFEIWKSKAKALPVVAGRGVKGW